MSFNIYKSESTDHPQSLVVAAVSEGLPTSVDLWDNSDGTMNGSAGACDLFWWPGWMLDDDNHGHSDFPSWKSGPWVSLRLWPGVTYS